MLIATAAALAATGCGGGGESESTPLAATGPADPAYAAKADAICATALDRTRQLGREFTHSRLPPSAPDLLMVTTEKLVRPGIAIRQKMADRLRALPPPHRGQASVQAYLELFDPLEVLARQRLRVGLEHDLDEAQRLEGLMREIGEEQKAAAQLAGLDVCATDFVDAALGGSAP